jgi:hypothetical protein
MSRIGSAIDVCGDGPWRCLEVLDDRRQVGDAPRIGDGAELTPDDEERIADYYGRRQRRHVMRRRRSRIQEEIEQVLESDRAELVREIVDDAGERAVRLAEEVTVAARSAGRDLPSAGILLSAGRMLLSASRILLSASRVLRSVGRILPSSAGVLPALVRRKRVRGRRRTAILLALVAIVVGVGIAVAARRRAGADDDDAGERALDGALMDSFPASDPPAHARAPSL